MSSKVHRGGALAALVLSLAAAPGCLTTCGDNSFPSVDGGAGDGGPGIDAPPGSDAAAPLTFVDFTAGGCESGGAESCVGPGPLTVHFSPITPAPVAVYLWDFGDGERSSLAAPSHTYRDPGTYSVSLDVEGPGGALGVTRDDFVTVTASALGAPCTGDLQCESGVCVCGDGDGDCPPGLAGRGMCAAPCDGATPCDEGVCTDLDPSGAGTEDWQRSLCLPGCAAAACGAGLACEPLREAGADGWVEACFAAGVLAPVGGSCADAGGALDDAACASGQCQGEGARGLCAYDCSVAPCPDGSDCATFAGALGEQCLARCELDGACEADPWLGCEAPGGGGDKGFTVAGTPEPGGYCAPRSCQDPGDCGSEGQCAGGFCEP
jgi:PKD repeat protein